MALAGLDFTTNSSFRKQWINMLKYATNGEWLGRIDRNGDFTSCRPDSSEGCRRWKYAALCGMEGRGRENAPYCALILTAAASQFCYWARSVRAETENATIRILPATCTSTLLFVAPRCHIAEAVNICLLHHLHPTERECISKVRWGSRNEGWNGV